MDAQQLFEHTMDKRTIDHLADKIRVMISGQVYSCTTFEYNFQYPGTIGLFVPRADNRRIGEFTEFDCLVKFHDIHARTFKHKLNAKTNIIDMACMIYQRFNVVDIDVHGNMQTTIDTVTWDQI